MIINTSLKLLKWIKTVTKKSFFIIIGEAIKAFNLKIKRNVKRGIKGDIIEGVKKGIKGYIKRGVKKCIKGGVKRDNNYYK